MMGKVLYWGGWHKEKCEKVQMSHTRCFIGPKDCREPVLEVWEEEESVVSDHNSCGIGIYKGK